MRENEKNGKMLKASLQKFVQSEKSLYNVLSWGFYSQTPLQITKITNQTLLQKGTNWEEIQKVTKESKSQKQ